jgi:hypothetical protein
MGNKRGSFLNGRASKRAVPRTSMGTFNGMRSGSSKRAGSGLGGLRIVTSSPRPSWNRKAT